jgi:hypothetical protein
VHVLRKHACTGRLLFNRRSTYSKGIAMKLSIRKLLTIVLMIVLSVLLTACAAQAAGLQQLPDEGRILVLELITSGLIVVLLWVGKYIPIDARGYAQAIAAVLSPLAVTGIERYLQLIPPIYDNLVLVIIHYIVLFLGGVATVIVYRRVRDRATKALLS